MSATELLAGAGGSIKLIDEQILTASGNWTKVAAVKPTDRVLVWMWGAGGGGYKGGASYGSGGLGGTFVLLEFFAFELPSSIACVIGSGGFGPSTNGDGGDGGYSYFGGFFAPGGRGGQGSSVATTVNSSIPVDASIFTQFINQQGSATKILTPKTVVEFELPSPPLDNNFYMPVVKAGANGGLHYNGVARAANTSIIGGAGGASSTNLGNAGDGQAPGGGGGAVFNSGSNTAKAGNGARGEIRVRVLRGAS